MLNVHRFDRAALRLPVVCTGLAALLLPLSCVEPEAPSGWAIPAEIAISGAAIVGYDAAPAWDDGAHCASGLTPGALALGSFLQERFPQIVRVYGFECRPNSAFPEEQSVHGTGRAIDLAIATIDAQADVERGDPVANWLVEHSSELGVQLIIWNRTIWLGDQPPPKQQPYTGPDPHVDHIHVELTEAAALRTEIVLGEE